MKLKKIKENDGKITFKLRNSSPAMANAIRRISMNHIPVLAIEDVGIIKNSSPVFDETVAQRLGQVPLDFDAEKFVPREDCDCEEGCMNCEVRFSLESKGPGTVYSGEIKCESEEVKPLHDKIPITELDEGQEIELEATANVSTGDDHSKHQAAISSYQYYPIIEIDQDELSEDEKKRCVEVCPKDVFKLKDGELTVSNEEKCDLCKECVEDIDNEGLIVTGDEERFIFKVESISSLDPKDILQKTVEILRERADKVIEKLG